MLRDEDEPLLPSSTARRRVENLVVQFTKCTFTYTEAQIPRTGDAGSTSSSGAQAEAGASNKSNKRDKRGSSLLGNVKAQVINKVEKMSRRLDEAVTGNEVGRRYVECVFRPGDKVAVQNYVNSLKLRCQISFVRCTFEYRQPTLCERISAFLLSCCGFLVERDPWTGREEISDETFRIDELPRIIDKMILNIQQSTGAGGSIPIP